MKPKTFSIQLSVPSINFSKTFSQIKKNVLVTFEKITEIVKRFVLKMEDQVHTMFEGGRVTTKNRFAKLPNFIQKIKLPQIPSRQTVKRILYTLFVLLLIVGAVRAVRIMAPNEDDRISVLGAKAEENLNREFVFPLKDVDGETVSEIKYVIEKAELKDELIVQGKRASSVKGRTFLILTLKITNSHDQTIEINTRDYNRLSVNGIEQEWLAPDVHNDPVEVQPLSTKFTRVGYPINDTDTNLVLQVGELKGDKEKIVLNLQK